MIKKLIQLFTISILLTCVIHTTANASFRTTYNILNPSDWAKNAVCHLEHFSMIQDEPMCDSDFNAMSDYRETIRRDAVAYLLVNLYEYHKGHEIPLPQDYPLEPWPYNGFEDAVMKVYGIGLMQGHTATQFGYTNITRQEFAVVLYRAARVMGCFKGDATPIIVADKDTIADWALDAVSYVYSNGIMTGIGNNRFSPNDFVTKEMAYVCIHRLALSHNVYDALPQGEIDAVEFTPIKPTYGDLEKLYAAVNEKEKRVIQNALKVFPNAFEIHAYTEETAHMVNEKTIHLPCGPDYKNREYGRLVMRSKEGDFSLILTEEGIFSTITISNKQFEVYKDLIFLVMDLSQNRSFYLDRYETVKRFALKSEDKHYFETSTSCSLPLIAFGYDMLYDSMHLEINDIYLG